MLSHVLGGSELVRGNEVVWTLCRVQRKDTSDLPILFRMATRSREDKVATEFVDVICYLHWSTKSLGHHTDELIKVSLG